jgi:hypothetical protein
MDVINSRITTTADDDDAAIRMELLGIVGAPAMERAQLGTYQTASDPGEAPTVMHVYRVGERVRVYRAAIPTPAHALESVELVVLDTSSVTPANQVRLFGGKRRSDPIHDDLLTVIGKISAMQDPDVSAEYLALAEAACASQPTQQTPEEVREWAQRLGAAIVED